MHPERSESASGDRRVPRGILLPRDLLSGFAASGLVVARFPRKAFERHAFEPKRLPRLHVPQSETPVEAARGIPIEHREIDPRKAALARYPRHRRHQAASDAMAARTLPF